MPNDLPDPFGPIELHSFDPPWLDLAHRPDGPLVALPKATAGRNRPCVSLRACRHD